jgi:HD-GYP domain-containing protein (c-di-GMP phosphodiesterase class II)
MQSEDGRLEALLHIAQSLNSTLSLDEVLQRAMKAAEGFVGAESSSIWQLDEKNKELYFRVLRMKRGIRKEIESIRLPLGKGIVGWVAQHGRYAIVNDVHRDPRWSPAVDEKSKFATRSILSVPLTLRNRIVGVIQLVNKIGRKHFDKSDLRDLQALSGLIAVAVENARLYEEIHEAFLGSVTALSLSIEKRDTYTGGHTKRVLDFALAIGEEMGLTEKELHDLKLSAILHDVGKIGIPDNVLNKPAPLDDAEFKIMKRHPKIGAAIMGKIPFFKDILPGMRYHHETMDGKGYPYGLRGEQIPLQARIVAVADAFDAMTSNRPYRDGMPVAKAVGELRRCSDTQFDGKVVEAFVRAIESGRVHPASSEAPMEFGEADVRKIFEDD